jgi:hypothetical protein
MATNTQTLETSTPRHRNIKHHNPHPQLPPPQLPLQQQLSLQIKPTQPNHHHQARRMPARMMIVNEVKSESFETVTPRKKGAWSADEDHVLFKQGTALVEDSRLRTKRSTWPH